MIDYLDVTIGIKHGVHFQEPVLVAVARLCALVHKGPRPACPLTSVVGDAPALPALKLLPALVIRYVHLVIGQKAKVVDVEGLGSRILYSFGVSAN